MKLHQHRHHEHHGKRKAKKSHKLLKKMAKLERKLSKYSFDNNEQSSDIDTTSSSDSSSRSRSHSRSRKRRAGAGRRHHRHHHGHRRFASRDNGSSSSSSSDSSTSSGSSSDSSRSPSPHHPAPARHHRHAHLSRSRSFAGRGCSPSAAGGYLHRRHHHRHPHSPHRRPRFWNRRYQDGIQGCLFRLLAQSEPNLQDRSEQAAPEDREIEELVDLGSEPEAGPSVPQAEMEQDVQEDNEQQQQPAEQSQEDAQAELGLPINEALAKKWTEQYDKGFSSDARHTFRYKYPVSKNCTVLRAPKLNKEIVPIATEAGVKRDMVLMYTQSQIGAGLSALGQAMTDLNGKLKGDKEFSDILQTLDEAAAILVDSHLCVTEMRLGFMLPELKKAARPVVECCHTDEYLYGKDFGEKVKNVKCFRCALKNWRGWKGRHTGEERCEKGHKRKHEHDGDKRKSKRVDSLGPFKKGHSGPKVH